MTAAQPVSPLSSFLQVLPKYWEMHLPLALFTFKETIVHFTIESFD